jgi:hypothetical protein
LREGDRERMMTRASRTAWESSTALTFSSFSSTAVEKWFRKRTVFETKLLTSIRVFCMGTGLTLDRSIRPNCSCSMG